MTKTRLALMTTALCGLLAVGIASFGQSFPRPSSLVPAEMSRAATPPPEESPLIVEAETDGDEPRVVAARSDSEIETEAQQPIRRVVQVDRGDTLMDLLLRAGVDRGDAHAALAALREVYNPKHLRIGQEVTVTFERPADGVGSGLFHAVSLQPEGDRQVSARRDTDGFAAREIKRPTSREVMRYSGTIDSSLFESATAAGIPVAALVEAIRAFSYDVDFQRDIQPGDRFELMFERFHDNKGQVVRLGDLLYARLEISGHATTVYRYVDAAGNAGYYDASGDSVRKALLRTPVDGFRLSSGFGRRKHPILGYTKMHTGVDFAAPRGTPIYAAGDGVVEMAGANGGYGYYVRIRHGQYSTAYAHLSRFAQGVRKGKHVRQGQIIGYVGSTGRSTGPHLHYEILANGKHVNPLGVKFAAGTKLAGKELTRFMASVQRTDKAFASLPESSHIASLAVEARAE